MNNKKSDGRGTRAWETSTEDDEDGDEGEGKRRDSLVFMPPMSLLIGVWRTLFKVRA